MAADNDRPDAESAEPELGFGPFGALSDDQDGENDADLPDDHSPETAYGRNGDGDADATYDGYDEEDDEGVDSDDGTAAEVHTALPPKVEAWRRRSATGAILTGFAMGLQQAFEKEHEQPAIIMETSGDPPRDLAVEAEVERARPRHSVVNIRPWLLPNAETAVAPGSDTDPEPDVSPSGEAEPEDG